MTVFPAHSSRLRNTLGRSLSLLSLLLAWFLATGCQWDGMQVIAWTRMFILNTEEMSFSEALDETFNPTATCKLCQAVSTAKQSAEDKTQSAPEKREIKLPLPSLPQKSIRFAPAQPVSWPLAAFTALSTDRAAPPPPPPRVRLG